MSITIMQWYDLVTPKSASNGDYAETGLNMIENSTSDLMLAAQWYIEALNDLGYYEINKTFGAIDWANEVAYAADPLQNYSDGSEEYHRVAANVPKEIQFKFNALVNKLLNK